MINTMCRFASILGIAIVFALSYTFFLVATHVYMLIVARFNKVPFLAEVLIPSSSSTD